MRELHIGKLNLSNEQLQGPKAVVYKHLLWALVAIIAIVTFQIYQDIDIALISALAGFWIIRWPTALITQKINFSINKSLDGDSLKERE